MRLTAERHQMVHDDRTALASEAAFAEQKTGQVISLRHQLPGLLKGRLMRFLRGIRILGYTPIDVFFLGVPPQAPELVVDLLTLTARLGGRGDRDFRIKRASKLPCSLHRQSRLMIGVPAERVAAKKFLVLTLRIDSQEARLAVHRADFGLIRTSVGVGVSMSGVTHPLCDRIAVV